MKVTFRRTGGFAPLPVSCTMDTTQLAPDEARELSRLIAISNLWELTSASVPAARDVHTYHIRVLNDEGQTKEVSFDQLSVPNDIKPLIEFLMNRSKEML